MNQHIKTPFIALLGTLLITTISFTSKAQTKSPAPYWQTQKLGDIANIHQLPNLNVKAKDYQLLTGDFSKLKAQLLSVDKKPVIIDIPLPDGTFETFKLNDSPIYGQGLAKKYPNIRTFKGQSLKNPNNAGRFDITPHGFHGMFNLNGQKVFIDPLQKGNNGRYVSYYKKDAINTNKNWHDTVRHKNTTDDAKQIKQTNQKRSQKINETLVTYRLAVSTSGEYTQYHGGTQALALSAIVTTINRVNEIYNRDLGVQLNIIDNNDTIIYTDPNTDPYNNTSDDIDVIQGVIDTNIGSPNYDIGHIFNTGDGGVAALGVVCDNFYKAQGQTGSTNPTGDPFDIDYVSHELGHQFGAEHIFNGTMDACENRSEQSAYEPGSGTSIMGYAGICGEQNVQSNSDAHFHYHSLNQMTAHLNGSASSCANSESLNNSAPTVNAGEDKTIPASTPFMLNATGNDSDGDVLSYTWEQYDLGTESTNANEMIDDGSRPLFRSFEPSSNTYRYFPQLSNILANSTTLGESMATTTRELNFVVTARDNKGNTVSDALLINVDSSTGPFAVTAPVSGDSWLGDTQYTVMWDVANTNSGSVNCANVDITLSSDSGNSFDRTLASNTTNNGSATISAPNIDSQTVRVKVSCSDNIFFAVSQADITITYNTQSDNDAPEIISAEQIISYEDNHISININQLTIEDDDHTTDQMTLSILAGDNYTVSGTTVIPTANYFGQLSVNVQVNDGISDSNIYPVSVTVNAINDAPVINSASDITTDEDVTIIISRAQFDITDVDNNINELVLTLEQGQGYQTEGNMLIPNENLSGTLTATIIVSDGTDSSEPFSFNVTVNSINDAPQLAAMSNITIDEDNSATIGISDLSIEDPDSDTFTLMLSEHSNLSLEYSQNQSQVTITPDANYHGQMELTLSVSDGSLTSNQQSFTFTINPVNDNPQTENDSFIVNQDSEASNFDVLANDSDIDSETLTLNAIEYEGSGIAGVENNMLAYKPPTGFSGQETLTYTVIDNDGGQAQGSVTIIVNPTVSNDNNNSSSSGGGSLGIASILLLGLLRIRAKSCS